MNNIKLLFLLIFVLHCTSNPFWDDPSTDGLYLSGTILTENNSIDTPVSVWLETFESYTTTDQDGNFSIEISNTQSTLSSISGPIKIYFFIYNYQLDSAIINLTNGRISNTQTDFSINGVLVKTIELKKIMSGSLALEPFEGKFYDRDSVQIVFNVEIYNSVNIDLYKYGTNHTYNVHSGLIFHDIESDTAIFYRYSGYDAYGNLMDDRLIHLNYEMNENIQWKYVVKTNQINLVAGEYQIIPYFIINHDFIPLELINAMDGDSFSFSNNYLNIPIDIVTTSLLVE